MRLWLGMMRPHERTRAHLPDRRVRLHLPGLPRAAATVAAVRRDAGGRGLWLLQHAVQAAGGQRLGGADPSGRHFRRRQGHLPQRALPGLQGEPSGAAGRPDPAIRADPRRGARLRRALHRAGQLRGRRHHRHLCQAGARARRHGDHRVVRQGSDAAGRRQRDAARHHEEQAPGHSRGVREVRRGARKSGRRPVAGGRFRRQRARRPGHRHQDRRPADQRVWRP